MRKITYLLALLLLTVVFLTAVRADEPIVRVALFWSETCSHCHYVLKNVLPPLQERYGDQLEVLTIELSNSEHYELWWTAMEAFQVPDDRAGVPMLFIGDHVLIGSNEIPEKLPGLIEHYLAEGGVDYPDVLLSLAETPTVQPAVHLYFFTDRLCAECQDVQRDVLEPLREKYGPRLVIERRDVEGSIDNYDLLHALEQQYGVTRAEMPVIFVGQEALSGEEEIRQELPGLVEIYLVEGGVPLPEVTPLAPVEPTPSGEDSTPEIHMAYFYQAGCRECDRVQLDLNYLQSQYPQLTVHTFDVKEEAPLCEWLGERAGISEGKRLTAPAIFVGDDALVGEEVHIGNLETLISRYVDSGAKAFWEEELPVGQTISSIVERFRSFSVLTVLGAGLIDGLNPCAFATLVFFVSYLAFTGRKGKEVLAAGTAFALGVFLTYLGVGVGLLKFLATLPFLSTISRWVYGLTAVFCLALAAGSLYDWWQARQGRVEKMRLKLPTRLRRRINEAIREGAGMRVFVPMTFVTGVVISIIELACTGQVYLPTILFVLGVPGLQTQAFLYLLLYNLMFIFPLVVVFVLAYFGTTSEQLGMFIHRRMATIKLVTAGLFILLAGWLVVTLV